MKYLLITTALLLSTSLTLFSQAADIEGDTKIIGKIDIITADGDSSVFIGANAGINDDGTYNENIFIGTNAGRSNTTGFSNTFVGRDAGVSNTRSRKGVTDVSERKRRRL